MTERKIVQSVMKMEDSGIHLGFIFQSPLLIVNSLTFFSSTDGHNNSILNYMYYVLLYYIIIAYYIYA